MVLGVQSFRGSIHATGVEESAGAPSELRHLSPNHRLMHHTNSRHQASDASRPFLASGGAGSFANLNRFMESSTSFF